MEISFQQRDMDDGSASAVTGFLTKLEELEGPEMPLTQGELTTLQESPTFEGQLWSLQESAGSQLVGLGAYRCEEKPELFTACLPDHREMSLFLPMLKWADGAARRTQTSKNLVVWAWEHDICIPYLLLRLNFSPAEGTIHRIDAERRAYTLPVGQITDLGSVDG